MEFVVGEDLIFETGGVGGELEVEMAGVVDLRSDVLEGGGYDGVACAVVEDWPSPGWGGGVVGRGLRGYEGC